VGLTPADPAALVIFEENLKVSGKAAYRKGFSILQQHEQ
jgi:hypothetical protein